MEIAVECHAGHRGEEEPRVLVLGERRLAVTVVDRWHGPDYRYFRLTDDSGAGYIVRHDERRGLWQLTHFDRQPGATTAPQ